MLHERGVAFTPGEAFYRAESAQGRDLAMLAASLYKKRNGNFATSHTSGFAKLDYFRRSIDCCYE